MKKITIKVPRTRSRNEHARALHVRAGNAGQAVAVDTRPKRVASKKPYSRKGRRPSGVAPDLETE